MFVCMQKYHTCHFATDRRTQNSQTSVSYSVPKRCDVHHSVQDNAVVYENISGQLLINQYNTVIMKYYLSAPSS